MDCCAGNWSYFTVSGLLKENQSIAKRFQARIKAVWRNPHTLIVTVRMLRFTHIYAFCTLYTNFRIRIRDLEPDCQGPGSRSRQVAPPKRKRKKISRLKSLNVLCKKSHDGFDDKKISYYKFLTNFFIINLSLDPDPDRIRIQQQAGSGSGSGFNKIPGSGFSKNCNQCCGSMTWCVSGSRSADPCLWQMDADPDPAIFVIDLQDAKKNQKRSFSAY